MNQRSRVTVGLAAAVVAALGGITATADAKPTSRYQIETVSGLGGTQTFALDINNRGEVTGNSRTGSSTLPLYAFQWRNGETTPIGRLPLGTSEFSRGYAINDQGVVVGESGNGPSYAFRWSEGVLSQVGSLNPAGTGVATDLNGDGHIVGTSSDGTSSRGFVRQGETLRALVAADGSTNTLSRAWSVNDRGEGDVVGSSRAPGLTTPQATLWKDAYDEYLSSGQALGSLGDGRQFSEALAVNDRRWVVGRSTVSGSTEHAFVWKGEGMPLDLGSLGQNHSRALDVNERGDVVGNASKFAGSTTLGTSLAWIWRDGQMTDLNTLVPTGSGWDLLSAEGINNRGQITGYGRIDGEIRSFVLTPRPA